MLREFEVEVLLSFDKNYDDHELHTYLIKFEDDSNMTERQIEDKRMMEAFDQCSKEHGSSIRHALEINTQKEIKK